MRAGCFSHEHVNVLNWRINRLMDDMRDSLDESLLLRRAATLSNVTLDYWHLLLPI